MPDEIDLPDPARKTASGCLFGLALGDALGYPTEFMREVAAIEALYGKGGPQKPEGSPAQVTDDTQITFTVKNDGKRDVRFTVEPVKA